MNSLSTAKFTMAIKEEMRTERSVIQAVINVCAKFSLEPDRCKKYLNDDIRQKIEVEARAMHMLRGDRTPEPDA